MGPLQTRFPDAYRWAFEGTEIDPPAHTIMSDAELARRLTSLTGHAWRTDTISRIIRRRRGPSGSDTSPASDSVYYEDEVEQQIAEAQAEDAIRAQKSYLRTLVQDEARFRTMVDSFRSAISAVPPIPFHPLVVPTVKAEEVQLALFISDTQIGQCVDPLEVGDSFAYSTNEFDRRWLLLEERFIAIYAQQARMGRRVTGVHLWIGGDLVENHVMHTKQRMDVDRSVSLQVMHFVRTLTASLQRIAAVVPEIWVQVVGGNHDRFSHKPGEDKVYDQWGYIIGSVLDIIFTENDRIHITAWTTPTALFEIGNSRFLMHHGHGIKGWAGFPWYGIERRVGRWQGLYRHFFHYVLMGHFHQPATWTMQGGTEVIVNGAFFSGTSYSINDLALATPAAQWAFVLSKEQGILERYKIVLEPIEMLNVPVPLLPVG